MDTVRASLATAAVCVLLASSAAAQQQKASVCDLFTDAEIQDLIGPIKQKQELGSADSCSWTAPEVVFMVARIPDQDAENMSGLLDSIKGRGAGTDITREEPGIGDRSVSEIASEGGRVTLVAGRNTTAWSFTVEHVYRRLQPEEVLSKLRALAKKALGAPPV